MTVNKLQTISNDKIGRRTEIARSGTKMTETRSDAYGYNDRSELTNAVKNATLNEYAYQYDDIGNRKVSLEPEDEFAYDANELNQYTSISNAVGDAFVPTYDADGNQTLVKTKTGVWSVVYNGENRPVSWTCGTTNIVMKFDRMGRRVEYIETVSDDQLSSVVTNKHQKFVYDGYLCIQRLNGANNAITELFEWDPTERVATRPMFMQYRVPGQTYALFYTHDGNKNVSEVVHFSRANGVAAHYEYAPFGEVTAQVRQGGIAAYDFAALNPWRFSSEYADAASATVYYNYRHYEPVMGRWMNRDPMEEDGVGTIYSACRNSVALSFDFLGMSVLDWYRKWKCGDGAKTKQTASYVDRGKWEVATTVKYEIVVAGPKLGGYPGEGDSSTLFFWYSQKYIDWGLVDNKDELLKAISKGYSVPCRMNVRYAVDCECECNGKTLHEWSEYSDWAYIYGMLKWDALGGRPYCECGKGLGRFYNRKKPLYENACKLD